MQMRRQFPQQAAQEQEFLAKAYAEVRFKKGEREWKMASYHQRRSEYGAARFYYDALVKNYSDTPFSQRAQEQMVAIADKPAVPPQHFTWLVGSVPEGGEHETPDRQRRGTEETVARSLSCQDDSSSYDASGW